VVCKDGVAAGGMNSTCSSFFLSLAVGVVGVTPWGEGRRSSQARRGDGTDAGGPAASPEPGARGHGGGRGGAHGGQRVAAARELARPQLVASPGAATTVAAGWRMQRQATQERLGPSAAAKQRTAAAALILFCDSATGSAAAGRGGVMGFYWAASLNTVILYHPVHPNTK